MNILFNEKAIEADVTPTQFGFRLRNVYADIKTGDSGTLQIGDRRHDVRVITCASNIIELHYLFGERENARGYTHFGLLALVQEAVLNNKTMDEVMGNPHQLPAVLLDLLSRSIGD